MARRTPFPFRDYLGGPNVQRAVQAHLPVEDFLEGLITGYEEALADEYMSGDIDSASYNEGLRQAREEVLVEILGVEQSVMDAYWQRTPRPEPETYDLPLLSDPDTWLITYEQVEQWSGQRLNAEGWQRLNEAIPKSTIPGAIGDIVFTITDTPEG